VKFLFLSSYAHLVLDPEAKQTSGGAELQVALLAAELAKRGHQVTIIGGDDGQPADRTLQGVRLRTGGKFHTGGLLDTLRALPVVLRIVAEEKPDLIILGKQAIDDDNNQTGQMLAGLMGVGQATFASKVELTADSVTVTREVDGGSETETLKLPAIITVDLRLNEPRYASLPNIMKAKSKPMAQKTPADYGVDIAPRLTTLKVVEPAKRSAGIKVADVDELVAKLKAMGVAK